MSSAQRENSNVIFTSEKLDKSDDIVDAVKKLKTNDTEYYESNTGTASGAQDDLTSNHETFTHTRNGKFEQ